MKSVSKSVKRAGQFNGKGDPRNGKGPPKGTGGRPRLAVLAECGRILDETVLPKLETYVKQHTPEDAGWRWAADRLMDYGWGKPMPHVPAENTDSDVIPFAIRIVR